MEKYPNAVVYRLKCYTTNTYYIGSTVNLPNRMSIHKGKKNGTASKSIIAGGNYGEPKILLDYPCNDVKELFEMEQCFLDTYREKYGDAVLNHLNAYTTKEERREKQRGYHAKYRAENPEKIKETKSNYYKENPEKVKERVANYRAENIDKLTEKFNCECGGTYQKKHKATHFGTKIHQKFIHYHLNSQKQVSEAHEG